MTFFVFFRNYQKNLNVTKFQKLEDLNLINGVCEGTLRGLQILPLSLTAQILVVFEI